MRITVRQLKSLIREATEEALSEMPSHKGMEEEEAHMEEEEAHMEEEGLREAISKAYRAGFRKGRASRR